MPKKPLNGERTHPLRPSSIEGLRLLERESLIPAYRLNPGIRDRLSREGLAEQTPSGWWKITLAGRKVLSDLRLAESKSGETR